MLNRTGWLPITCDESDALRGRSSGVTSALTDPEGEFGPGVVYTEWCDGNSAPVLRDYRWSDPRRPCEHLAPDDGAT